MTELERDLWRLQTQNEEQQAEIDRLREQVDDLTERLDRLERGTAFPPGHEP